jgi:hypothetical protein
MNKLSQLINPGIAILGAMTEETIILHPSGKKVLATLQNIVWEREMNPAGKIVSIERMPVFIRRDEGSLTQGSQFKARGFTWVVEDTTETTAGWEIQARKVRIR